MSRRGGGSTIKRMKAGLIALLPAKLEGDDLEIWRAYFTAAIGGVVSAHRRTPNPEAVAKLAGRIADRAIEECRLRRTE
jgi:hypothetical protein